VRLISANKFLIGYISQLVFTARALHLRCTNEGIAKDELHSITNSRRPETNGKEIFGTFPENPRKMLVPKVQIIFSFNCIIIVITSIEFTSR